MLTTCATVMNEFESGQNEVVYALGYDEDDISTFMAIMSLARHMNVQPVKFGKNIISGGQRWNELAKSVSADVYSAQIDDSFIMVPFWDQIFAAVAQQNQVFSWWAPAYPLNVGTPCATKQWIERCGYFLTEHFPYWFTDTWFAETARYTMNNQVFMTDKLTLHSKEGPTLGFRDLDFWWGFFHATRKIRLQEAYKLSGFEGSFEEFKESRKDWIAYDELRDAHHRGDLIAKIEANKSVNAPGEKYLACYQKAQDYLKNNGLVLWE